MIRSARFPLKKPILLFFSLIAVAVSCISGYLGYQTVGMKTIGILPYENLFVGAFSQGQESQSELDYHDRILSIDQRSISNAREIPAFIERHETMHPLEVQVRTPHGEIQTHLLPIQSLSAHRAYQLFTPLLATGISFLIIAILVLLIQPTPRGAFPFVLYCLTTSVYLLCGYDFHTTYKLIPVLFVSIAMMPATIVHLSLEFPSAILPSDLRRRILFLAYGLSTAILIPYVWLFRSHPRAWVYAEYAVFFYISLAYLGWLWSLAHRQREDEDIMVQRQSRSILFGLVIGFGSIFFVMWANFVFNVPIPLAFIAPLCLFFPVSIVIAIFRSNLFLVQHLEAQIQERTERLRQKELELFQTHKLASIGLLASGTAHEIGNAMNVVISNLGVLKKYTDNLISLVEGKKTKEECDYDFLRSDLPSLLSDLGKSSDRVLTIMGNLRNFAKPETTQKTQTTLSSVAETTLHLIANKIPAGISITQHFESQRPLHIVAGQIHQVVLNLLLNAIDALDGRGTLSVRTFEENGWAKLSIQDDGPGIPADVRGKIFDPFFTTKSNGTGLGLSVSYGIVRDHGGNLTVESVQSQGACFTLSLPFEVQSGA